MSESSPKDLATESMLPERQPKTEASPVTAEVIRSAPSAVRRSMPMGLSIAMGILLAGLIGWIFHYLVWLMLVIYLSFIAATILEAPVQWLKKRGIRRGFAAVIVMLGSLLILFSLLYFITLGVYGQVATARADLAKAPERVNRFVNTIRHHFLSTAHPAAATQSATQAASAPAATQPPAIMATTITATTATASTQTASTSTATTAAATEARPDDVDVISSLGDKLTLSSVWTNTMWGVETISWLVISFFIVLYMLVDGADHLKAIRRIAPKQHRLESTRLFNEIAKAHRGWALASLANVFSASILTGLGLLLIGIPGAFVLGAVAGFGELIPNIGPFLGAMPAILFTLIAEPDKFLYVVGMFIVVQTVQSYGISPMMLRFSIQLPVLATIISVLVFGILFGFLGVLIAIPLVADCVVIWNYLNRYLEKDTEDYDTANATASGIRHPMSPDNTHPSRLRKLFRRSVRANAIDSPRLPTADGLERLSQAEKKSQANV